MDRELSRCIHVNDIGDTTWSDISHRQQVCIIACKYMVAFMNSGCKDSNLWCHIWCSDRKIWILV